MKVMPSSCALYVISRVTHLARPSVRLSVSVLIAPAQGNLLTNFVFLHLLIFELSRCGTVEHKFCGLLGQLHSNVAVTDYIEKTNA